MGVGVCLCVWVWVGVGVCKERETERQQNDHEATAMLKTQFLSLSDGMATDSNCHVMIVGATNRPQVCGCVCGCVGVFLVRRQKDSRTTTRLRLC